MTVPTRAKILNSENTNYQEVIGIVRRDLAVSYLVETTCACLKSH